MVGIDMVFVDFLVKILKEQVLLLYNNMDMQSQAYIVENPTIYQHQRSFSIYKQIFRLIKKTFLHFLI